MTFRLQEEPLGDLQSKEPNYLVTGDDLKHIRMLNVFEPCTLQIGDRNCYTLKEKDVIMLRDEWKKLEKESYLRLEQHGKKSSKNKILNTNIKKRPDHEESSDDEDIEDSEVEQLVEAAANSVAEAMDTDESTKPSANEIVSPKLKPSLNR